MNTRRHLRTRGTTRRRSSAPVKLNVEAAAAILSPIYAALPITRAAGNHNLAYTEVEWPTLKTMVEHVEKQGPCAGSKFYDLGCGRGRAVLYMALAGPFDMSVGIEVLPERIVLAQQALAKLKVSIPSAGMKVRIYESSFLNASFHYKDARAIFLSNTSFDDETQTAMFSKLNLDMPKGSLLFCSKQPVPIPAAFEKVGAFGASPTTEIHILKHL